MKNKNMAERFGSFCAYGEGSVPFLNDVIIPSLKEVDDLVLDVEGVRNMNRSFVNAIFANLIIRSELKS